MKVRVVTALICLLFLAAPAAAQGELGTITGTFTDAQGAVVPGVTATAVNLDTNVKTTAVSNQSGVYVLTSLVNGRYRLTATLDGFAPMAGTSSCGPAIACAST
jgi:Carboxypeptidase regulatory-like domain